MKPQRILFVTDAWRPQVNGVVRTLEKTMERLEELGHTIELIEPHMFPGVPCPFYPEIWLCRPSKKKLARRIEAFDPTAIHLSTEGPLGLAVRRVCLKRGWNFSTSYHTKFPEYLRRMLRVPTRWTYWHMRRFHRASSRVMVATQTLENELRARRFKSPFGRWSRGVDLSLFRPRAEKVHQYPGPVMLYVGRVSREKSIEDFLKLDLPGTKVIVGDGPIRAKLERQYPDAKFLGYRTGEALAEVYASADVFVFPSRTDTFGLVIIEALASGLPVAAYPVIGPIDIVTDEQAGCLNDDLKVAVETALARGKPEACVALAQTYTWENCTRQFLENLAPIRPAAMSSDMC